MVFDLQRFSSLFTVQNGNIATIEQSEGSGGSGNNFSEEIKNNVISFFSYSENYKDIASNTMQAVRIKLLQLIG